MLVRQTNLEDFEALNEMSFQSLNLQIENTGSSNISPINGQSAPV